ncbi:UvrD-helicase domain-containing protein [Roseivirga sp. BDSF3-8]|uniref:UvrD-helicase domain-containing protein n=1 Tax=Roseivirga sp. BDSF3-8 TaxID=3241598 RepID=UPI00353181E1
MTELAPFLIYRSSAGSGKTYTLAREYIRLAIQQPATFRTILAVTFTNKATEEMKSRIVSFLYKLSRSEEPSLAAYLMQELTMDEATLKQRAENTLSEILHGFSRFNVSTIDSFFQKVIRAFAREIGLQSGFKVELDQQKVLGELADKVMAEVGRKKGLTEWLVRFAEEKVEEGKSWDLRGNIMELGGEIFREVYKSVEPGLQQASEKGFLNEFRKDLIAVKKKFESEMQACGRQAIEVMQQHALTIDDFSYKKSGVGGYLHGLAEGRGGEKASGFAPGKRVLDALGDAEKWTSKSSKRRSVILEAVEGGLQQCLQEAVDCFERDHSLYITALEALRYFYTFGILTDLTAKLQEYREEEGVMLISDAAPFLNQVISGNDSPFVYEKVGAYIRHYLVDEFQDTSALQWRNLHPLVLEAISQGQLSMVVGDVKQSIYRWRGGDWRLLLDGLSQSFQGMYTELHLDRNWRSRQEIIQFNNALFTLLPAILRNKLAEHLPMKAEVPAAGYFDKVYEHVAQKDPGLSDKRTKGYIELNFLQEKDESYGEDEELTSWKDEVLRRLPMDIERLQEKGFAAGDIAILTRTARDGKRVADRLMEYKNTAEIKEGINYEVVSSESLFVGSAYSVHILLQAFRHLHNREDTVALANLIHDYNRYILGDVKTPVSDLLRPRKASDDNLANVLPPTFWHHRESLARLPLFELAERLIASFSLNTMKDEFPYLQAFQDLVLDFSREQRADIGGFLEWWNEKGHTSTVPMPEKMDAIRILTIHKSKGLQFPVVFMPFCDWEIDHGTKSNILWCSTEGLPEPFSRTPFLPIRYNSALAGSYFAGEYLEEMSRAFLDNLNLLYVALTRPESALIVYGHSAFPAGKPPKLKSAGHLLHYAVSRGSEDVKEFAMQDYYDAESESFRFGTLGGDRSDNAESNEERPALKHYPVTTDISSRLVIRPRSPYRPGREADNNEEARMRGTVIHDILAGMDTWKELEQSMRRTAFQYGLTEKERDTYQDLIDRLGELPEIREWYGGGYEVKKEAELVAPGGRIYRPDRVMRKGKEIIVLDFKTGTDDAAHHQQVQGYLTQIQAMGYEEAKGWLVYVDNLRLVPVTASSQMNLFER